MTPQQLAQFLQSSEMTDEHWTTIINHLYTMDENELERLEALADLDYDEYQDTSVDDRM